MAFGTNLLGAIVGGCLEYLSLIFGYRALLILAAMLYVGAYLAMPRSRPPATPTEGTDAQERQTRRRAVGPRALMFPLRAALRDTVRTWRRVESIGLQGPLVGTPWARICEQPGSEGERGRTATTA